MPKVKDKIFISIGVSKPSGGLEELPGAITAAERMAAWAKAQGYETLLLHDKDLPEITIDLLRERITRVIESVTNQVELKRLVIFFAGHGAALAIGDQYWILSNWKADQNEAIKVSSLQRVLEYYGPKQVAIIGDACQEFSSQFIELIGSAVLKIPDEEKHHYELDQFFAVDVGKQAFMIKAKGGKEAFCLFTEVLLDALEGDSQVPIFEEIDGDRVVTSQAIAQYLDANVQREASKYGLHMTPHPRPGFYTDRAYLTIPSPPIPSPPDENFSTYSSGDMGDGGSPSNREFSVTSSEDFGYRGTYHDKRRDRTVGKVELLKSRVSEAVNREWAKSQENSRKTRRRTFVKKVQLARHRNHFETGCGVCVSGAVVEKVEASFGVVSIVDEEPNWFRIDLGNDNSNSLAWTDTLVSLSDGRIASVCAVKGFVAALDIVDETSLSLLHRPIGTGEYEVDQAIFMLAQMHSGLLSQREIIDSAAMLRDGKHRFITLGCIVAQFYDAIRDIDSLHSIAAFYAMHQQPVPLDIILFGGGAISEDQGRLYAEIPSVEARKPRTNNERKRRFTHDPTPGFEKHPIAGRVPWMRQAWGAVETASCDESARDWRRKALGVIEFCTQGAFTIVRPEGRDALYELTGITPFESEPRPAFMKYN